MKKVFYGALLLMSVSTLNAQVKKTSTPVKKPAPVKTTPAMKTAIDSFSYAIGLSIANFYKEQGITNINNSLVMQALNDAKISKPKLDDEQTNQVIIGFMQLKKGEKAAVAKLEGEKFCSENKKKPGVIELPSGLQYQVIKEGTGPKPTITDKVRVHYHGTVIDGQVFDSSVDRGQPIEFNVNGVIPGWTEALLLMPVGSKWKVVIPSDLAYGDNQSGPYIKPGSTLLFDIELLDIVK